MKRMNYAPQVVSQGYPLWAVTDQAFDAFDKFANADDFAQYMIDTESGGPFLVVAWECAPGARPQPVLAGQLPPHDVVIYETARDAAIRAAVEEFRSWMREAKAEGAA